MTKMSLSDRFRFRRVDLKNDKQHLLDLECELNYENETHLKTQYDFEEYRERWLIPNRTKKVYKSFKTTCRDRRTICGFMETASGEPAAFFLVTFQKIAGFDCLSAFVDDIYVYARFRKQGIGTSLLGYLESKAKEAGADVISLGTGSANTASNHLFKKCGYTPYRSGYEKKL